MSRIIDENSSAIELLLVDVGDRLIYNQCEGKVFKVAIIKSPDRDKYYFLMDSGKTIMIEREL